MDVRMILVNKKTVRLDIPGRDILIPDEAVRMEFMGDIDIIFLDDKGNVVTEGAPEELYYKAVICLAPAQILNIRVREEAETLKIITNNSFMKQEYGAVSALIDKTGLETLADQEQDDLYVIPSSVHECIAQPVKQMGTPYEMRQMVRDVNQTLAPEQVLSQEIFIYKRETGELSLVSVEESATCSEDLADRSLDDISEETQECCLETV